MKKNSTKELNQLADIIRLVEIEKSIEPPVAKARDSHVDS
jgi:hypothetical protein